MDTASPAKEPVPSAEQLPVVASSKKPSTELNNNKPSLQSFFSGSSRKKQKTRGQPEKPQKLLSKNDATGPVHPFFSGAAKTSKASVDDNNATAHKVEQSSSEKSCSKDAMANTSTTTSDINSTIVKKKIPVHPFFGKKPKAEKITDMTNEDASATATPAVMNGKSAVVNGKSAPAVDEERAEVGGEGGEELEVDEQELEVEKAKELDVMEVSE